MSCRSVGGFIGLRGLKWVGIGSFILCRMRCIGNSKHDPFALWRLDAKLGWRRWGNGLSLWGFSSISLRNPQFIRIRVAINAETLAVSFFPSVFFHFYYWSTTSALYVQSTWTATPAPWSTPSMDNEPTLLLPHTQFP